MCCVGEHVNCFGEHVTFDKKYRLLVKIVISFLMKMCCVGENVNCFGGNATFDKMSIVDENGNFLFDEHVLR